MNVHDGRFWDVIVGDCRHVLAMFPAESVHAIVTDPPYELRITGHRWDGSGVAHDVETWRQCLRVLKPGGYLLAFGAARTHHRLAVVIEDSGFELRDVLMWLFGSGFPKSGRPGSGMAEGSSEREQWAGWGTTLRPCYDPVIMARRPMGGSVIDSVLTHGVGAINIDGCRYGDPIDDFRGHPKGRWPTNVLHDGTDDVLSSLGRASRIFYCPKVSDRERNAGLTGFPKHVFSPLVPGRPGEALSEFENHHPTVKPTALMRWLVRLITPPGGIVCDPFCGSGSTGRAAMVEGHSFVGIERDVGYAALAAARCAHGETLQRDLF